ncbi:hypothetical protein ACROYT_G033960 [Oculina patagonica]
MRATDGTGAAIRTALVDFRKAFDLVDHQTLIAKLLSLEVKPTSLNWIIDFLRDRQQRVKLHGTFSTWLNVTAGVPQGTQLGPWLFLAMINDLDLPGESMLMWKFADDTTISEISNLQHAVDHVNKWSQENHLQLNPRKCKEMLTCFKRSPPLYNPVEVDGLYFERVSSAKVLGLTLRNDLKWNDHIEIITSKAAKRLYLLRQLKRAAVSSNDLVLFHCSVIRSVLEYSCQLFHSSLPGYLPEELERIQRRAMRIIFPNSGYRKALEEAGIPTLAGRRDLLSKSLFNDIVTTKKHKLVNLLPERPTNSHQLRNRRVLMFWTSAGQTPKIERATLSGTQRVAIVTFNVLTPRGIDLDRRNKLVFWASYEGRVESVDYHGNNRKLLHLRYDRFYGVAFISPYIFFSDWDSDAIQKLNAFNTCGTVLGSIYVNRILGLVAYDSSRQISGTPTGPPDTTTGTLGTTKLPPDTTTGPAVTCPTLSPPTNGELLGCNTTEMLYDTVCRFSCKEGTEASGSTVRRCTENGTWSGNDLVCAADDKSQCDQADWQYSLEGSGWSVCPKNNTYLKGLWRHARVPGDERVGRIEFGRCCPAWEKAFANQSAVCTNAYWWYTLNWNHVWALCPDGYFLNGLYKTDGPNLYNIEEGQCCRPLNGDGYDGCYDEDVSISFDSSGWSDCQRTGYYMTGIYKSSCEELNCIEKFKCCRMKSVINCTSLIVDPSGPLRMSSCDSHYGAECNFSCTIGYHLNGSSTVTCVAPSNQHPGVWNNTIPSCEAITCPALPAPSNGARLGCSGNETMVYDTVCQLSCNYGYIGSGSQVRRCQHNGTWSGQDFTCQIINCTSLTADPSGPLRMSSCDNHYGAECNFSCAIGYRLNGSSTVTCVAPGNQHPGMWNNTIPTCEVITCPALPAPSNGTKLGCPVNATIYYDTVCQFSCNNGYIGSGSQVRRCQHNGAWSGQDFTCQIINCTSLTVDPSGPLRMSSCGNHYGSKCNFSCTIGHRLNGSSALTCVAPGNQHPGSWNNTIPTCEVISSATNSTTETEAFKQTDAIIIGACVGGVLLLVIVIAALVLVCKRRNRVGRSYINDAYVGSAPNIYSDVFGQVTEMEKMPYEWK